MQEEGPDMQEEENGVVPNSSMDQDPRYLANEEVQHQIIYVNECVTEV